MSKRKEAIARYAIIINRLRHSPASYNQILQALESESEIHSYNYTVSKRAFGSALNDIRTIYGISIEFDFAGGKYHIVAEGEYENNQRLLEAFDTFNALKVTNRLPQFIHYETRRPSGTEHMSGLLRAIQNKLRVTFYLFQILDGGISIEACGASRAQGIHQSVVLSRPRFGQKCYSHFWSGKVV